MRLSIKGMAISIALMWGGCLFTVGLINSLAPSYGGSFLEVMSSVYPGFHVTHAAASVFVGGVEGLIDGAIAGALLAWLYNRLTRPAAREAEHAKVAV